MDQTGSLSGLDRIQQQAFETIVGGVADAFDLSKEDPRTVERYDTCSLLRPDDINPVSYTHLSRSVIKHTRDRCMYDDSIISCDSNSMRNLKTVLSDFREKLFRIQTGLAKCFRELLTLKPKRSLRRSC